ncbi:protein mono-ADP-ribosyltransferase PARP14-like [Arctopsyche grandis]|uniref:protein mono-ADP-ribosyltransferase PARP14-like n=1 Tax=Arctopsyche grandis TaxID=121162 RepID=UPI00406D9200
MGVGNSSIHGKITKKTWKNVEEYPKSELIEMLLGEEELFKYTDNIIVEKNETLGEDRNSVEMEFKKTARPQRIKITKVKRLQNPYLRACYLLRKKEYEIRYEKVLQTFVFHGTKKCNVPNIRFYNLNWRSIKVHKFGKGISFSTSSSYASCYGDHGELGEDYMFGVHVLESSRCEGNDNMSFPPEFEKDAIKYRYDTSENPDGKVIVKYRDDEFYPAYIIKYKKRRHSKK